MAELLNNYDTGAEHEYIVIGNSRLEGNIKVGEFRNNLLDAIKSILIVRREKPSAIIFHSLPPRIYQLFYLFQFPLGVKKYIAVWGGEINHRYDNTLMKRTKRLIDILFFRRMTGYITALNADYSKIKDLFGGCGDWINLPAIYPSNIISSTNFRERVAVKNILIGASNLKRNRHIDVINKIASMPVPDDAIYHFPFSYGGEEKGYLESVKAVAVEKLNGQAIFYESFMPFEEYLNFLSKMDAAFFISTAQQGLGNINQLIAFGAQIYVEKGSDIDKFYGNLDIILFDWNKVDFEIADREILYSNHQKILAHQSLDVCIERMRDFFSGIPGVIIVRT